MHRLAAAFFLFSAVVLPATARPADIAVSVDPMVFEFTAPYGGEQRASVTISNPGTSPEYVRARAINWSVSSDGSVSLLSVKSQTDRSLSRYLQISPTTFTLTGGESRSVSISLHMPSDSHVHHVALWGGFLLEGSAVDGPSAIRPGATIIVYDSTQSAKPDLELRHIAIIHGPHPEIVAHVVNTSDSYARPIAHLLFRRGSTIVRDESIPMNAILPGAERWIKAPVPALAAGRYQAELLIDFGPGVLDGTTYVDLP